MSMSRALRINTGPTYNQIIRGLGISMEMAARAVMVKRVRRRRVA